ncbi:MAG TPA: hypothetical protein VMG10_03885 [Gemmataceae bacterium]|nr:hypothetical protein [Gemmataceae bacterium]
MCRILLFLQLYCGSCCLLGMAALSRGEEPADAKLQKLSDESRSRAEGIQVSVVAGGRKMKAKLHSIPVMKYTDVPRLIDMATLWVWQDEGCPVALGKVEAYKREGGTKWLYCFASTSTGLVDAKWPGGRRFQAREVGIKWSAIKGSVPQETAAGRRRQMKALFRRFSAIIWDNSQKTTEALRPLARPLHEYASPKRGVIQGVLCGFTTNGTNPAAIVILEAVSPPEGKDAPPSWRYSVVRMTANRLSVTLDKAEVFTGRDTKSTWTHFWESASKK